MVIGLLKDPQTAEETLTNLSEAEFDSKDISVLAKNTTVAHRIANPAGPFEKVKSGDIGSRLELEGVSSTLATTFQEEVNSGGILVVIDGEPAADDVAEEMLKENGGNPVIVIPK